MRSPLLFSLVFLFLFADIRAEELAASAKPGESLLRRVFVVGASASAGFGTRREGGGTVTLAQVLDAAITEKHDPVGSSASAMFFLRPRFVGDASVKLAEKAKPTLLVAVDFLFWLSYGVTKSEAERLENLERGLEYLDRVSCPILLSRIPDMHESVGKMLVRRHVPKPETLTQINARIDQWAKERERVTIVPLVRLIDAVKRGEPVAVAESRYPARSLRKLLQRDELHPTVEGLSAIAVFLLETLATKNDSVSTQSFERDVGRLAARLLSQKSSEKSREKGSEAK